MEVGAAIERQRGADHHDGVDVLLGEIFGGRENPLPGAVVALGRERADADPARNEAHARIHLQPFVRHCIAGKWHHQPDGEVIAHVFFLASCLCSSQMFPRRQSSVAPAALMIGAHLAISARRYRANSSGVLDNGCIPSLRKCSRVADSASTPVSAVLRRPRSTAAGSPAPPCFARNSPRSRRARLRPWSARRGWSRPACRR